MSEFWIKTVSMTAVAFLLYGYNNTLETREKDEQIARLAAQVEETDFGEQQEGADIRYQDGIYEGEGIGFGGAISVEVTVISGKIEEIRIVSAEKEDGAYLSMAEKIIPDMLEKQSADVDTISGATFSSTGIREAVSQALEKAR